MKNNVSMLYLSIILAALFAYLLFDRNVSNQEAKAGESLKISKINMVEAECGQNLRLCAIAEETNKNAEISIKTTKSFIKYAEKNIEFGNESKGMWESFIAEASKFAISDLQMDKIKVKKDDLQGIKKMNEILKDLMNKTEANGYNFEF